MKTLLVPTDFNPESTKIIDAFLLTQNCNELNIIFLHAFKLSDSITDMLMLSRRSRDYEHVSDAFYQKMDHYKQKYGSKIGRIGIEYFYGSTLVAFKNLLEALQVDAIAYPQDYDFCPINKYSIDPNYLIMRAGCRVFELNITDIAIGDNLFETRMPQETVKAVSSI
ncbi:hypothetical protein [Pedobacter sp. ASV12]|uniref:hypothetical protein n=1 Tax=Pedobacter sp. ASV12 TaxID=2795120 RepID=UPI0018ED31F7|nr:hypothetical protein [Pedobacter sp. ASV12]